MGFLSHGQVIGLTSTSFLVTFSWALSTPKDATHIRFAAVILLAALQYSFAKASPGLSEHSDIPYGIMTLAFTFFWHTVDYLIVLRVSSVDFIKSRGAKPTRFTQYVWTPLGLLCNWRRLGTPWQISKVPPFSVQHRGAIPSRSALILQRLFYIVLCFIVLDLCSVSNVESDEMMEQRALLTRLDQISGDELQFRASLLFNYTLSAIAAVYCGYAVVTILGLALGLSSPVECPPMFGSLCKAYSVRGYWGDFYHQGLRRAICGPADIFVDDVLHISRGTLVSRYLRLILAFAISGAIHGYAEISSGVPPRECGHFLFFTSNAFAIIFEDAVKGLYQRAGSPLPILLERLIGYGWVGCWLFLMEPYWAYSSAKYAEPRASQLRPILAKLLS